VVEGIRALSINGAPVLHTDEWFLYRGGKRYRRRRRKIPGYTSGINNG
jgi:hypothetical protein